MTDFEDISSAHPDHNRIVASLQVDRCPDCGNVGFDPGPRGGLAQNIFCQSCGAGFNVTKMIVFVQRIGKRHAQE